MAKDLGSRIKALEELPLSKIKAKYLKWKKNSVAGSVKTPPVGLELSAA